MPDQLLPDAARRPAPPDASAEAALAALRAELDRLDDAMHDLLMQRASVVARLASSGAKGNGPPLRPGREAQILRRLLGRHQGPLPRSAVVRLWRELIAAMTGMQGAFSVAACAAAGDAPAARLAREHFGLLTPLRLHPTPARALAAVTDGDAAVAVLPAPSESELPEAAWWTRLQTTRLEVVAALPFLRAREAPAEAYVISSIPADPTGADRTLLALEEPPEASRARIAQVLTAAGLPPAALMLQRDGTALRALAEVDGMLDAADPRLAALPVERVQRIGAFALPASDAPDAT
jgi:chorismate mutase